MSRPPIAVSLQCPNCGASLSITHDMDLFACGYCGSRVSVRREGGTVSLEAVTDAIAKVQAGTDKTAAELAIKRQTEDLAHLNTEKTDCQDLYEARIARINNNIKQLQQSKDVFWTTALVGAFSWLLVSILLRPLIWQFYDASKPGNGGAVAHVSFLLGLILVLYPIYKLRSLLKKGKKIRLDAMQQSRDSAQAEMEKKLGVLNQKIAETAHKLERNKAIADS